ALDLDLDLGAGRGRPFGELLQRQHALAAAAGHVHEDVGAADGDHAALLPARRRPGLGLLLLGGLAAEQVLLGEAGQGRLQVALDLLVQLAQARARAEHVLVFERGDGRVPRGVALRARAAAEAVAAALALAGLGARGRR